VIGIAAFSHFLGDFLGSMFKPMGPYFVEQFGISTATFGSVMALIASSASLLQIGFGLLYDGVRKDGLHIFWLLVAQMVVLALAGFAPSFPVLGLLIFFVILVNSAYHPLGASLAGSSQRGRDIAIFSVFGTFGSALGPVFITSFSSTLGFSRLWLVSVVALAVLLPAGPKMARYEKVEIAPRRFPGFAALKTLFPVFLVVLSRSFVMDLFHTYVPLFLGSKGASLITGGTVITLGMLFGMVTNFFGSTLIEKVGIFKINLAGFATMGIMGLLFFFLDSTLLRAACFIGFDAGAFLTMSANIVEAQRRMPTNRAFASSVTMGFAWSIGGFLGAAYAGAFGNDVGFMILSLACIALALSALMVFFSRKFRRLPRRERPGNPA